MLPLNGVPGELNTLRNSRNYQHAAEKIAEEWPDWNEHEDLEPERNATVDIQKIEFCDQSPSVASQDTDEKLWDDVAHSSDLKLSSRNGSNDVGYNDITEVPLPQKMLQLKREYRTLTLNASVGPSSDRCSNRSQQDEISSLPKASFSEKSPKLESGLGEEFTIQVRRKECHDTELDWFADMVPDIKPSSALLILPELGSHPIVQRNIDSRVYDARGMHFSSKFAAAEVTEVRIWDCVMECY